MRKPIEHRRDAVGKKEGILAAVGLEIAPSFGHSEGRRDLFEAARGDPPVVEARSTGSLAALRQVQCHGCGRSPDLIEELRIAAADDGERLPE